MALTESTRNYYEGTRPPRAKWSWAHSVWFVLVSSALCWGGLIGLIWHELH